MHGKGQQDEKAVASKQVRATVEPVRGKTEVGDTRGGHRQYWSGDGSGVSIIDRWRVQTNDRQIYYANPT